MVNHTLWLSQQDQAGLLARLVFTSPGVYKFTSYALPTGGLQPNGVALANDGQVWTAAYRPERIYLPLMLRSSGF
jgi:streptogramin lyase